MTFYSGLRDNTAAPLIAQFGQSAIYRPYEGEYDNALGKVIKGTPSDLSVKLLDLPVPQREFSDDVTARASGMFLVEAASFNAASARLRPAPGETILLGGAEFRILAINTVGPSGVAVIYKMAVQNV